MLKLPERTRTEHLNPLTEFNLFECKNVIGPSDAIPKAHNQVTSHLRKTLCVDDNANGNDSDFSTAHTVNQLPTLPANDALARAVSQVQLSMDGWVSPHIYKLFVVLVYPPPDLDLSAIEGLHSYLTKLLVEIGSLINNGIREIACHCWWALMSKHSKLNLLQT